MVAFLDVGAADFEAARLLRGKHRLRITVADGLAWLQQAMPEAGWVPQPDGSALLPPSPCNPPLRMWNKSFVHCFPCGLCHELWAYVQSQPEGLTIAKGETITFG